jgi:anti-sigma regulatory factor (Ser/Thr protein kinase)
VTDVTPEAAPVTETFTQDGLARVRSLVHAAAVSAALSAAQIDRLLVAVSEIATNAIRHGGGHGSVSVEQVPDGLAVEISDAGPGLPPGLTIGRPGPEALGGRGLWLARAMCAELRVRSSPEGVTVRMFAPRSDA